METARIDMRSERGQTMTEFAFVLPVLCLIVFGLIQFGLLFNSYLTLTDAVRAGARKATVSRQEADPLGATVAKVRRAAADLEQASLAVSVTSSWAPGSDVTVSASYPYEIDLLGLVVKSGWLTSTTTERVE